MKKKPSDIEINFPYIIIPLRKINDLKRFKNIIGMLFKGSIREGHQVILYYYKYLGQHPNNLNVALWSTREELRFNPNIEFCFTFPFTTGIFGTVFFTNSLNLFALHLILFSETKKIIEKYN